MSIKINRLEAENVKRIKAVKVEPKETGLTILGGDNRQGKTSVLDSIAWALGGNKFRPSEPQRRESTIPPFLKVELSNGLVVERKGKNSSLKVIDPQGNSSGQALLDEFIEELALDLPKFLSKSSKEKATTLLQIIGVGDKLYELEQKETELYNMRHSVGQIADQKEKYAKEMPHYGDVPETLVSASDLIKQQQEILARNGENQKKRENLAELNRNLAINDTQIADVKEKIKQLEEQLNQLEISKMKISDDIITAQKTVAELQDESTAELEISIENIEEINRKVRSNLDRDKAIEDARGYRDQYDDYTSQIEKVRKEKFDLLNSAKLPLEGLSVEDGDLTYNGDKWDNMSGSDQLIVATAIVRKLNPNCGFVLLDKLEQMDLKTLNTFGEWLESEGLQAIATRVSTGSECEIIIEDGYVAGEPIVEPVEKQEEPQETKWKAGTF